MVQSPAALSLLTTSAQRAYRSCPRKYFHTYEQGYRPATASDALLIGTLGHRGLEAWWLAAQRTGSTVESWDAAVEEIGRETDPFQRARALSLLWGYHCRWESLEWGGQPIKVLGVEVEFRGPLLNPESGSASRTWERAGKLDALVEVGGRVYVVEHKTTSEEVGPGAEYWQRLQMDAQVSNYVAGARLLGHSEIAGVIYDVIRKPGMRPAKATPEGARKYTKEGRLYANQRAEDETPESYYERLNDAVSADLCGHYARALVVRLESEEREAAADAWQTGQQIRDARRLRLWPRNPDACLRFGHRCEMWGVCTGTESLDDVTRFRRTETPHEELQMCRAAEAAAV